MSAGPTLCNQDKIIAEKSKLDIPREGLDLVLAMPTACELAASCELHLSAPEKSDTQDDFTATSDKGFSFPDKGLDDVNWLLVEFGRSKVVTGFKIDSPDVIKVRVKVFQNSVWVPLTPMDTLALSSQSILPVVTDKLMFEFVKEFESPNGGGKVSGVWVAAPAMLTGKPQINTSSAPYDIKFAIGEKPPFYSFQGALAQRVAKVEQLDKAVNESLNESGETTVPLKVTASLPGSVKFEKIKLDTASVIKKLDGLDDGGRIITPWCREVTLSSQIGADTKIEDIRFHIKADLVQEQLLAGPESVAPFCAQLCSPRRSAAQRVMFNSGSNHTLTGVDLYLRPVQFPVKALVALHPDDMGEPSHTPCPGTSVDIAFEARAGQNCGARWYPYQVPRPMPLASGVWWIVLTVETGKIHWCADSGEKWKEKTKPGYGAGGFYRIGSGSWIQRGKPGAKDLLVRLRADASEPPGMELYLQRSQNQRICVKPDADGWIRASDTQKEALNKENTGTLELVVKTGATGVVTISNPYIKVE